MRRSTKRDPGVRAADDAAQWRQRLAASLDPPELRRGGRWWLAYSGGLDSTVLLHALASLPGLQAVHVHHGLQAAAGRWAQQCRAQCRRLRVPFHLVRVRVDRRDPAGPEAAARAARYAALRGLMRPGDGLITAHQRDDQAETVLLRVLRGTGVDGLAGMRPLVEFPPGVLWRPLLEVPRARIRAAARAAGLRWIEDPHNDDPRYARSRLRRELMPRLERLAPGAAERLARLAASAAQAAEVLADAARADLGRLDVGGALSIAGLTELSAARRHNALRAWLSARGEPPAAEVLRRIEAEVLGARADAAPVLRLGALELRRYRDRLFAGPVLPAPPDAAAVRRWNGRRSLRLSAGCGSVRVHGAAGPLALELRFVAGGERLKPACGGPTRTLRNLFQEAGVPPWVRCRTPLLYESGALRCVGDYWCDHAWAARGLRLAWDVELPGRPLGGET